MYVVIASNDEQVLWGTFDDELDAGNSDGQDGLGFPAWTAEWVVPGSIAASVVGSFLDHHWPPRSLVSA